MLHTSAGHWNKIQELLPFCLVHCRLLYTVSIIDRTRGAGHKLKCIWLPLNIREHFFYWHWELAQVIQGGCGVSNLGGIQKPPGHGPGQVALGGPAWAQELDQITSRGRVQAQLLCESVAQAPATPATDWHSLCDATWAHNEQPGMTSSVCKLWPSFGHHQNRAGNLQLPDHQTEVFLAVELLAGKSSSGRN